MARWASFTPSATCVTSSSSVCCAVLVGINFEGKYLERLLLFAVFAAPGSYLDKFFNKTKTKTPEEIAQYLEEDDEVGRERGRYFEADLMALADCVTFCWLVVALIVGGNARQCGGGWSVGGKNGAPCGLALSRLLKVPTFFLAATGKRG